MKSHNKSDCSEDFDQWFSIFYREQKALWWIRKRLEFGEAWVWPHLDRDWILFPICSSLYLDCPFPLPGSVWMSLLSLMRADEGGTDIQIQHSNHSSILTSYVTLGILSDGLNLLIIEMGRHRFHMDGLLGMLHCQADSEVHSIGCVVIYKAAKKNRWIWSS